jgi:hypothetical protein
MSNTKAYAIQRKCKGKNKDNSNCKGIALIGQDYCKHHALTSISMSAFNTVNTQRYNPRCASVREHVNNNLGSANLLDLRQEVALLQALLQQLLDAPINNLDKQLQVIDRIDRLVANIQRAELSAKAIAQAQNKTRLVINKVAVVINTLVNDKALKLAIARALSDVGYEHEKQSAAEQEAAATSAINTEQPINAEAAATSAGLIAAAQEQQQAPGAGAETGDTAPGNGIEQDIPSVPQSHDSQIPT